MWNCSNPSRRVSELLSGRKMILLTGGLGLLGKELRKHIKCVSPSHSRFDITNEFLKTSGYLKVHKNFKLIVHCAAFTDLVLAEKEKELCYRTNVIGTRNLASLGIPMLYISTEYVFDGEKGNYSEEDYPNPQNFYSLTKLLGEYESRRTRSVVVRCLFKPRPFKHEFACVDQFTSGDYVDSIADGLVIAIKKYEQLPPTIHIGTGRKSTFNLARQSRDVKPISVLDIKTVKLPRDTSLNTSLWERIKSDNKLY